MQSRRATAEEREYLKHAQQVPCLICDLFHDGAETPAELHHLDGKNKPNAHLRVISLCTRHHRTKDNAKHKRWYSRHGDGLAAFEEAYMSEEELLLIMQDRVAAVAASFVGAEHDD